MQRPLTDPRPLPSTLTTDPDRIQGHHDQQSVPVDRAKPSAGADAPKPTTAERSRPAEAPVTPIDDAQVSRALVGRVLLRCSLDGSLLQGSKVLRYTLTLRSTRSPTLPQPQPGDPVPRHDRRAPLPRCATVWAVGPDHQDIVHRGRR